MVLYCDRVWTRDRRENSYTNNRSDVRTRATICYKYTHVMRDAGNVLNIEHTEQQADKDDTQLGERDYKCALFCR